tara:strand:+ start:1378 stop:1629 length:252 start_codon:yes stop_codon:yes gene_type:complete
MEKADNSEFLKIGDEVWFVRADSKIIKGEIVSFHLNDKPVISVGLREILQGRYCTAPLALCEFNKKILKGKTWQLLFEENKNE